MIYGIGCDIASVARIEKSFSGGHGAHFAARVYGDAERASLGLLAKDKAESGENTVRLSAKKCESATAAFAAKEAFLKAAGTGLAGFALAEIEILHRESGAPYYAFSGKAAAWIKAQHLAAKLSLSHEAGLALAFCTLETEE